MNKLKFKQKHILISGAGSGLGKALAQQLAAQQAKVAVIDKDLRSALATVELLTEAGCDAWAQACDISQQQDVDALVRTIKQRWPCVDGLINNAGVATAGGLEYEDMDQWQWVLNINLLGMVRMTKAMVPMMPPPGFILNIASQAGLTPIPLMASYNASKAAVVSFSETMHLELAYKGIHVSVACPSFFPTNLDKSLRSEQPGIAKLVSKMLSRSELDAQQVATIILQNLASKRFLIMTHKSGKQAYRLRRFLPLARYLRLIEEKTRHLTNIRDDE